MDQKLTRVGTFSQTFLLFLPFFLYIRTSHHPIVLSRFLCHLSSPYVFSFSLVERLAQVRLEPNHTLLQTDNLGCCKVCIFSTLCSDSTRVKSNHWSCKEGLTRLLLRLSFLAHSTKPPNLSKVTCTCPGKSDVGFFLPFLLTLSIFPLWLSLLSCMIRKKINIFLS